MGQVSLSCKTNCDSNAATIAWDNTATITITNPANKYLPKGSELGFVVSGF